LLGVQQVIYTAADKLRISDRRCGWI
jgi:hypothetical protein